MSFTDGRNQGLKKSQKFPRSYNKHMLQTILIFFLYLGSPHKMSSWFYFMSQNCQIEECLLWQYLWAGLLNKSVQFSELYLYSVSFRLNVCDSITKPVYWGYNLLFFFGRSNQTVLTLLNDFVSRLKIITCICSEKNKEAMSEDRSCL